MSDPRIVIGAGPNDRIPAKVCEYTIDHNRQMGFPFEAVHTFDRILPRWSGGQGTDFSFVRFWIPELLNGQGRAIYLDSDMLAFADLQDLWDLPMEGKVVLRTSDSSVLLIDCKLAAKLWRIADIFRDLDAKTITYRELMRTLNRLPRELVGQIPDEWNHLERYQEEATRILHYTNINSQPWRKVGHPLGHLWYEALRGAVLAGFVPMEWLKDLPPAVVDAAFKGEAVAG